MTCLFDVDSSPKKFDLDYYSVIGNAWHHLLYFLISIKTQGTTLLMLLLLAFIVLSFLISGAEVALFSLNNRDINMLKTKHHPAARRIVDLLDESKEVYTSLLIAGTFINICIIVLSNFLINELLHLDMALITLGSLASMVELLIKVLLIAFLLIFFCKVLPKVWATQNKLRFAHESSLIIKGIHLVLFSISRKTVELADSFGKSLGANNGRKASLQELDQAIDFTTDDETTTEEKNILKGIVKFGNTHVKQIMRSRLEVSGIEVSLSMPEVIERVEELHYSRLPVYTTNLDEVVGILNTKDLLGYIQQANDFDWHTLLRQPFFVPETKLIEDLLRDFQTKRIHFAVVVDEFGGTSGIVTMEDILEEIIGDIKDEFDEEETGIKKVDEYNFIFEGRTTINDACRAMSIPQYTFDRVRGESESIAGLILELAGEFPAMNTVIPCGDFDFTVLEAFRNRIFQVKVTIKPISVKQQ
jgi:gliding motility-associated protein GldE